MAGATPETATKLFTVGHSNHPIDVFVALLRQHGIEVLVDARSQPVSRYLPHFNKEALNGSVTVAGLRYLFLGRELGGRPEGTEFYDEEGHVRYDRLAESPRFREGIDRLERGVEKYRVAIMCSEENPTECHRYLLISRVLRGKGMRIAHIRGDGRIDADEELQRQEREAEQPFLFADFKDDRWRSPRAIGRTADDE